jgi:hypothetical protein
MTLRRAALAALAELLAKRDDLAVLGVEPTLARYLGRAGDPQLLDVSAGPTRAAIGAGLAFGGRTVVTLAHEEALADGPLPGAPQVLLTTSLTAARRWWAAGARVVRPVTDADVASLLDSALAADGPVVVRLDDIDGILTPGHRLGPAPVLGAPRALARGDNGVVAGQGPALARLCQGLADAEATLLDLHTLEPGSPVPPGALDEAVLIGPAHRAAAAAAGQLGGLARLELPVGPDATQSATVLLALAQTDAARHLGVV